MEYLTLALAVASLLLHFLKAKKPGNSVVAEAAQIVDVAKGALPTAPSA